MSASRALAWANNQARKEFDKLPPEVREEFNASLIELQLGDTPDNAKPAGEGLPGHVGARYRG